MSRRHSSTPRGGLLYPICPMPPSQSKLLLYLGYFRDDREPPAKRPVDPGGHRLGAMAGQFLTRREVAESDRIMELHHHLDQPEPAEPPQMSAQLHAAIPGHQRPQPPAE